MSIPDFVPTPYVPTPSEEAYLAGTADFPPRPSSYLLLVTKHDLARDDAVRLMTLIGVINELDMALNLRSLSKGYVVYSSCSFTQHIEMRNGKLLNPWEVTQQPLYGVAMPPRLLSMAKYIYDELETRGTYTNLKKVFPYLNVFYGELACIYNVKSFFLTGP